MNINNKSLNYSLLFTTIFLVGLSAIFSYGYMGYKANIVNNDTTISGEVLKPENILNISGDNNFALNITLDELSLVSASNSLTDYIDDTKNITINLSVDSKKYTSAVTCDYVFYYEPTTEYTASSEVGNLTELGFSGNCRDCNPSANFGPISIAGKKPNNKEQLYEGKITTNPTTGTAIQNWQFSYRFYNLDIDQSSVIGQKPSGKIIIEGKNCYATKNS